MTIQTDATVGGEMCSVPGVPDRLSAGHAV
jgi:hypothetical protein